MDWGRVIVSAVIAAFTNVIGPVVAALIWLKFFEPKEKKEEQYDRNRSIDNDPQPQGDQTASEGRNQRGLQQIIGKLGPLGDAQEGIPFGHEGFDGIRTIKLGWDDDGIVYLEVEYTRDRVLQKALRVGGVERNTLPEFKIELDVEEYVSDIHGYYDRSTLEIGMIKSLTFFTNTGRKFGHFGYQSGNYFELRGRGRGRVIGFHGRAGSFLSSFGVFVSPNPLD